MNKRLERIRACLSSARDSAPGLNCGLCDRDESAHADWCPLPEALADVEALLTASGDRTVRDERADVLAWLRAMPEFDDAYEGSLLRLAAEGIEAGEHVGASSAKEGT